MEETALQLKSLGCSKILIDNIDFLNYCFHFDFIPLIIRFASYGNINSDLKREISACPLAYLRDCNSFKDFENGLIAEIKASTNTLLYQKFTFDKKIINWYGNLLNKVMKFLKLI